MWDDGRKQTKKIQKTREKRMKKKRGGFTCKFSKRKIDPPVNKLIWV